MPKTTIYITDETVELEKQLKEVMAKIDRIEGGSYCRDMLANPSQAYRTGIIHARIYYLDHLEMLLNDPAYADIVKALGYKK